MSTAAAATTPLRTARPALVYDDGCGFCRRVVVAVRLVDWLRRIDVVGYGEAVERWPEVGRGRLGDGVRMRFPDGTVNVGIDAVRSVAVRTPLGVLVAWPLYVPPVRALGDRAYRFVAARRRRDACAVPAR